MFIESNTSLGVEDRRMIVTIQISGHNLVLSIGEYSLYKLAYLIYYYVDDTNRRTFQFSL